MFYIYILQHVNGSYYSGYSKNIAVTIEHFSLNSRGESNDDSLGEYHPYSNKSENHKRLPIKLVYHQWPYTQQEAVTIAKHIATWSNKTKQSLINNDWKEISKMAKSLML